jgi:hypothetical protein
MLDLVAHMLIQVGDEFTAVEVKLVSLALAPLVEVRGDTDRKTGGTGFRLMKVGSWLAHMLLPTTHT